MLTKLLRMLGEIDMSDLITAISGLAGALVGALITLHTSKSEAKEKLKQELAAQEEVISETQLEFRYKRLHDLYEMQEQCARIESGLRRVLSFSCEDTVQTYEENEIYPTISLDFLDNCKAILMTGSHDARLNALHVRLSIYNEAKKMLSFPRKRCA